jgi:hypothetical protein
MPERRREVALVASPDEEFCASDLDKELGGGGEERVCGGGVEREE